MAGVVHYILQPECWVACVWGSTFWPKAATHRHRVLSADWAAERHIWIMISNNKLQLRHKPCMRKCTLILCEVYLPRNVQIVLCSSVIYVFWHPVTLDQYSPASGHAKKGQTMMFTRYRCLQVKTQLVFGFGSFVCAGTCVSFFLRQIKQCWRHLLPLQCQRSLQQILCWWTGSIAVCCAWEHDRRGCETCTSHVQNWSWWI